jgi:hypothetical protein
VAVLSGLMPNRYPRDPAALPGLAAYQGKDPGYDRQCRGDLLSGKFTCSLDAGQNEIMLTGMNFPHLAGSVCSLDTRPGKPGWTLVFACTPTDRHGLRQVTASCNGLTMPGVSSMGSLISSYLKR